MIWKNNREGGIWLLLRALALLVVAIISVLVVVLVPLALVLVILLPLLSVLQKKKVTDKCINFITKSK